MDNKYWIWLLSLDIPNKIKIDLINKYESPKYLYYNYLYLEQYNESINMELLSNDKKDKSEVYYKYINKYNIKIVKYTDKIYPSKLYEINDYPIAFFAIGNLSLLAEKHIGIVGARDSSEYGEKITSEISNYLSRKGYVIISGLAKGIDRKAHISTCNYKTIAVIGSGITKKTFYPKENYNLFIDIIRRGGLVISENMPDAKAFKWRFPMRNRIIAGLADSIIVTEAKERSGSLITARFALEYGKDVYTVPGNIDVDKYKGNNLLLFDGAIPITDLAELEIYFDL